jgi:hypothetical protein
VDEHNWMYLVAFDFFFAPRHRITGYGSWKILGKLLEIHHYWMYLVMLVCFPHVGSET